MRNRDGSADMGFDDAGIDRVVLIDRRERRGTLARMILIPVLLTALAAFWVVEKSRPNLALLAAAAWILWVVALAKASTIHMVAGEWVGVRGPFLERRLHLDDVREIRVEWHEGSPLSVTFLGVGLNAITIGGRAVRGDRDVEHAISSLLDRLPDKIRSVSGTGSAWI